MSAANPRERHDLPFRLDRANDDLLCSAIVLDLRRVVIQLHYINTQNCSVFVLNFGVFLIQTHYKAAWVTLSEVEIRDFSH